MFYKFNLSFLIDPYQVISYFSYGKGFLVCRSGIALLLTSKDNTKVKRSSTWFKNRWSIDTVKTVGFLQSYFFIINLAVFFVSSTVSTGVFSFPHNFLHHVSNKRPECFDKVIPIFATSHFDHFRNQTCGLINLCY